MPSLTLDRKAADNGKPVMAEYSRHIYDGDSYLPRSQYTMKGVLTRWFQLLEPGYV